MRNSTISNVEATFEEATARSLKSRVLGSTVTLEPGDTLYIPPYWYYRLQSESLSVALTVNSPTAADGIFAQV